MSSCGCFGNRKLNVRPLHDRSLVKWFSYHVLGTCPRAPSPVSVSSLSLCPWTLWHPELQQGLVCNDSAGTAARGHLLPTPAVTGWLSSSVSMNQTVKIESFLRKLKLKGEKCFTQRKIPSFPAFAPPASQSSTSLCGTLIGQLSPCHLFCLPTADEN